MGEDLPACCLPAYVPPPLSRIQHEPYSWHGRLPIAGGPAQGVAALPSRVYTRPQASSLLCHVPLFVRGASHSPPPTHVCV
jgi:hypothetical protein